MANTNISRYPIPDLNDLPEDLKDFIVTINEKTGFIPNVFLALAHRPHELRAFMAYHDVVMDQEGGLSKADREMIVVATSSDNNCQYCVIAHGAILRIRAKDPLIADQIAINYKKADITEKQRAMLNFAIKVSRNSDSIEETDREHLRSHGFSDDDIWDIVAITAFFCMSNRLANFLAMRPNDEFYLIGREKKEK